MQMPLACIHVAWLRHCFKLFKFLFTETGRFHKNPGQIQILLANQKVGKPGRGVRVATAGNSNRRGCLRYVERGCPGGHGPPAVSLSYITSLLLASESNFCLEGASLALNLCISILLSTSTRGDRSKTRFSTSLLVRFPQRLAISFWIKFKFFCMASKVPQDVFPASCSASFLSLLLCQSCFPSSTDSVCSCLDESFSFLTPSYMWFLLSEKLHTALGHANCLTRTPVLQLRVHP